MVCIWHIVQGEKFYNKNRTQVGQPIIAAWFDENATSICHEVIPCDQNVSDSQANDVFKKAHLKFTKQRVEFLNQQAQHTKRRTVEWVGLSRKISAQEKWEKSICGKNSANHNVCTW